MNLNVFNSDISPELRAEKVRQLTDYCPRYERWAPMQNSGPFERPPGVDLGGYGFLQSPLGMNPLNAIPLGNTALHNTTIGFNSLNLNPFTFGGNIGCMIDNPSRNMVSQRSNLVENKPGKELVITNALAFAELRIQNKIPRLQASTLGIK